LWKELALKSQQLARLTLQHCGENWREELAPIRRLRKEQRAVDQSFGSMAGQQREVEDCTSV
jgi:hypothetical protein